MAATHASAGPETESPNGHEDKNHRSWSAAYGSLEPFFLIGIGLVVLVGICLVIRPSLQMANDYTQRWKDEAPAVEKALNMEYEQTITIDREIRGTRYHRLVDVITVDGKPRSDCRTAEQFDFDHPILACTSPITLTRRTAH